MKLDTNNNDAISSVGDDLGHGYDKYKGTVVGIDGCLYGIPHFSKRIIKYDPINDTTSFVAEEAGFHCTGGALGRDGCIYAVTWDGRVLKIDTANNVHCFVGTGMMRSWGSMDASTRLLRMPAVFSSMIHIQIKHHSLEQRNINGMEDVWHQMGSSIVSQMV